MTHTIAVDPTVAWLNGALDTIQTLCLQELGRAPSYKAEDPVAGIMLRMALMGQTGAQLQVWLHAQPEAVAHRATPPPPPVDPPLPTPFRRETVCRPRRLGFQGITLSLPTYGTLAWFPPALGWLTARADREVVYRATLEADCSHLCYCLSGQYRAVGTDYAGVAGQDYSGRLSVLTGLVAEGIARTGLPAIIFLAGDGQSNTARTYNDDVGWTYGYDWLIGELPQVFSAFRAVPYDGAIVDLTRYCLFLPGFDGVMGPDHGLWSPDQLNHYLRAARSLLPSGYLGLEFAYPYCHWGGGAGDYAGAGQALDTILLEFKPGLPRVLTDDPNDPYHDLSAIWQPAARMLGPAYRRPANQPSSGKAADLTPPWYLAPGTPRGPFYVGATEIDTYLWVRHRISEGEITANQQYLASLGYGDIG